MTEVGPEPGPGPGPGQPGLIDTTALEALKGRLVVAVGTDLVEIDRIRQVVARRPRFVERVFTPAERAYCEARNDPAERFAARFGAKEAVLKALGVGLGGADFHDIEVVRLDSGQPVLHLSGRAQALADDAGIADWLITISHSDTLAHVFTAGLGAGSDTAGLGAGSDTAGLGAGSDT